MTKTLLLMALIVLIYLYWKAQQSKTLQPDDIIERKGKSKETFWETEDFDLSDQDSTNSADD